MRSLTVLACFCSLVILPSDCRAIGPGVPDSQSTARQESHTAIDYAGWWQGTLSGTQSTRIQLRVSKAGPNFYRGVLYNVDHAGQPFASSEFLVIDRDCEFAISALNVRFKGKLEKSGNRISGTWIQDGKSQPLSLDRVAEVAAWQVPQPSMRKPSKASNGETLYEVATVKPNSGENLGSGLRVHGRHLEAVNSSVLDLIEFSFEVHKNQIEDAPEWLAKEKFDVMMLYTGDDYPGDPECKTMVKQVLAERFGLKTHRGSKEQPIYVLTSARTSPRLTKSEGDPNGLPGLTLRYPGDLAVRNATMGDFTGKLQGGILSRPVVDRTGIEGRFDFILKWTPDDVGPSQTAAAAANSAPGLATAIQEQLGLKLESTKSVASTLVVETVAHPTGN